MNMMRSDLESLELDARLIDSSRVIDGYIYLSEEIEEQKKQEKHARRTNILFGFLLASVALLAWDQYRFIQGPDIVNLEAFHNSPPALGDVLSDSVIEEVNAGNGSGSLEKNDIPEHVVKFIDADLSVEKETVQPLKVSLEEVKKPVKAKINIDRVLASGNKLFSRDRLMSPPVHNAFARYEKVLSVSPGHPEALKGIKKIVDRYVYLAEKVIAKKEHYKVPGLIKKAYQAGEKYMDVSILITRFSDYLSDDSIFVDYADVAGPNNKENTKENNTEKVAADIPVVVTESHNDTIFKADNHIAKAAYDLYADNKVDAAITMLKNFTQLSGFWGSSNDLLLKIYLGQGKIAESESLIYENKALDAYQFAEKAARIMMVRGDNQGALNMLTAYRPEFLENKDYYMLLASLYHKVENHQRAVYWYRQLLSIDHKNARLWLGLAVSLDAINETDDALQAFEYVQQYAKDESVVKQYVDDRKVALSDVSGTEPTTAVH